MSSSVSVTDTSENHYDSGSDSDDDEEDQKSTAESRFSYFSIKSSTAADKADKAVKFANTVTCLQVRDNMTPDEDDDCNDNDCPELPEVACCPLTREKAEVPTLPHR